MNCASLDQHWPPYPIKDSIRIIAPWYFHSSQVYPFLAGSCATFREDAKNRKAAVRCAERGMNSDLRLQDWNSHDIPKSNFLRSSWHSLGFHTLKVVHLLFVVMHCRNLLGSVYPIFAFTRSSICLLFALRLRTLDFWQLSTASADISTWITIALARKSSYRPCVSWFSIDSETFVWPDAWDLYGLSPDIASFFMV